MRHQADLVVPDETAQEIAVLKGIAAHYVMRAQDRLDLMERQRTLLARAVRGDLEAGERRRSTRPSAHDFDEATDDAARTRVVIDQIASLTDASAVTRHADLVSGRRGGARGWAMTYSRATPSSGCRSSPSSSASCPTTCATSSVDPDDLPDERRRGGVLRAALPLPPGGRRGAGRALPKLRVVQTMTAGVEHIQRLRARGRAAVQRPRHPRHLDRRADRWR